MWLGRNRALSVPFIWVARFCVWCRLARTQWSFSLFVLGFWGVKGNVIGVFSGLEITNWFHAKMTLRHQRLFLYRNLLWEEFTEFSLEHNHMAFSMFMTAYRQQLSTPKPHVWEPSSAQYWRTPNTQFVICLNSQNLWLIGILSF